MFCTNCGAENAPGTNFCEKCGKALPAEKGSAAEKKYSGREMTPLRGQSTHPYHKLGGWLAVLAYGMLIAVALLVFGAVAGGLALIGYARYLGEGVVLLGLLEIVLYIPAVYFGIKMYQMIKGKDPLFLRFYEMTMIVLIAVDAILMLLGAITGYISPGEHIKSLLESVLVFVAWTIYFCKSVRVRTYFGTDAYLKQSIFLKNYQAPDPVD